MPDAKGERPTLPARIDHVVLTSGGAGSWAAGWRVAHSCGTENLVLLFADTLIEDEDLYRFLLETAAVIYGGRPADVQDLTARALALPPVEADRLEERKAQLTQLRRDTAPRIPGLVWTADGRHPFEIFRDKRYLGNSRRDPCSLHLKRDPNDAWVHAFCDVDRTTVYVGIDWSEEHRFNGDGTPERPGLRIRKLPWRYRAPLLEPPYLTKGQMLDMAQAEGIAPPRLYAEGVSHNNCGGGCVKAGMGQWIRLYRSRPERYAWWEREEQAMRDHLGADVAMLTDRRGGGRRPITLAELRQRLEGRDLFSFEEEYDIGGCGCAIDEPQPEP